MSDIFKNVSIISIVVLLRCDPYISSITSQPKVIYFFGNNPPSSDA